MKKKPSPKQMPFAEIGFSVIMILLGSVVPLWLMQITATKHNSEYLALEALAAAGLALQFMIYLLKISRLPLWYYLVFTIAATLVIVVALS